MLSFSRCSEAAVVGAALVSVACEASSTRQTHGVLVAEALLQAEKYVGRPLGSIADEPAPPCRWHDLGGA